ncbi:hypothetical protein CBS101457_000296 [Exobasidium rhododendri]|nr:hypothetical protein CBS101457_000296 [Exobasidium rhododendri]
MATQYGSHTSRPATSSSQRRRAKGEGEGTSLHADPSLQLNTQGGLPNQEVHAFAQLGLHEQAQGPIEYANPTPFHHSQSAPFGVYSHAHYSPAPSHQAPYSPNMSLYHDAQLPHHPMQQDHTQGSSSSSSHQHPQDWQAGMHFHGGPSSSFSPSGRDVREHQLFPQHHEESFMYALQGGAASSASSSPPPLLDFGLVPQPQQDYDSAFHGQTSGASEPYDSYLPQGLVPAQAWTNLASTDQTYLVEVTYERSGYARESIKKRCRYTMTDRIVQSFQSGEERQIDLAIKSLFPNYMERPRVQTWMRSLLPNEATDVVQRLAAAAERRTIFVVNFLARINFTAEMAAFVRNASPQQCVELADELGMTRKADQQLVRQRKSTRGKGEEAWMLGTSEEQRVSSVKKLKNWTGKCEKWCYAKLRLSGEIGLGMRIAEADAEDMQVIGEYLQSIKPGHMGLLPPKRE